MGLLASATSPQRKTYLRLRAAPPTRGDGCSAATAPGAAPAPIKGWLCQKLFEARAPQPPVAAASQLRLNGQDKLAGKFVWGRG